MPAMNENTPVLENRKKKTSRAHRKNKSKQSHLYPRVSAFQNDEVQSKELEGVLENLGLYESPKELQRRQETFEALQRLLNEWAVHTASTTIAPNDDSNQDHSIPPRVALISFGSYRLGVHKPGADMDLLALSPSHCSRNDFFTTLVQRLEDDSRICSVHPIPVAYTPVIKFTMNGISIDLLFARLRNDDKLRDDSTCAYMIDDSDLEGLDEASVRSLNGARVAQVLETSVPNIDTYRTTLRAVKEWAIVHGLYSNVLGFLGGINYALLVACICKRHPLAKPPTLLKAFFQTFSKWNWPTPVMLDKVAYHPPSPTVAQFPVWDAQNNPRDRMHVMPILTPTYPSMNSAYNVGIPQLRRLVNSFKIAHSIVQDIEQGKKSWMDLYRGNEFFLRHDHYLQVNIQASDDEGFLPWFRFVESRLRLLIAGLDNSSYGVQAVPFGQFYYQSTSCTSFFLALRFSHPQIDLSPLVKEFVYKVHVWEGRTQGMDVTMEFCTQTDLPKFLLVNNKLIQRPVPEVPQKASKDTKEVSEGSEAVVVVRDETEGEQIEGKDRELKIENGVVEDEGGEDDSGENAVVVAGTERTEVDKEGVVKGLTKTKDGQKSGEQQQPMSWAMKVRGSLASPAKRART